MTIKEVIKNELANGNIDNSTVIDLYFKNDWSARQDVQGILDGVPEISELGAPMGYSENDMVTDYSIGENKSYIAIHVEE